MSELKVNDGIHGPLKINPEKIEKIKRDRERFLRENPVSSIVVYLANPTDKRWNGDKENPKCKECDIALAGYKTEAMCEGCSYTSR